jgi:hypothetical protein
MPSTDASPEARINGLTKMAEFRLARWTNRRQIEWKISASVWTFLAAISSAIVIAHLKVSPWALAILLGFVILIHFWWVHQNWSRNQEDIKAAFDYFEEVHGVASYRPLPERKRQAARSILKDAVPTCEIGITVLLAAAALYLACSYRITLTPPI